MEAMTTAVAAKPAEQVSAAALAVPMDHAADGRLRRNGRSDVGSLDPLDINNGDAPNPGPISSALSGFFFI